MTAKRRNRRHEHHNALSVPEQSMTWDNDKNAFVWVPDSKSKDGQKNSPSPRISNGTRTKFSPASKKGDTCPATMIRLCNRARLQSPVACSYSLFPVPCLMRRI